jgi:hypothetical protein
MELRKEYWGPLLDDEENGGSLVPTLRFGDQLEHAPIQKSPYRTNGDVRRLNAGSTRSQRIRKRVHATVSASTTKHGPLFLIRLRRFLLNHQ